MKHFTTSASPMLSGNDLMLFNKEFTIEYSEFMRRHHFDEDTADVCDMCIDMQRDGEFTQEGIDRLADARALDGNDWEKALRHWKNIVLHYENDYLAETAAWHEEYRDGDIDRDEYEGAFSKWRRLLDVGEKIWSRLAISRHDPLPYPIFTESREVNGHVREPLSVMLAGRPVPKSYMDAYVESVDALYRMSLLAESRGKPQIAARALGNRVSLHVKIFEHLGLDHDSAGEAEEEVRAAIDAYAEEHADVPQELAAFTKTGA